MGTVHLTRGHHGLYCWKSTVDRDKWTVLEQAMLSRPVCYLSQDYNTPAVPVIRAALRALLDLPGFDAAVSYNVIERDQKPHIALPHRVWGEISLGSPENVVLSFSHDSRFENRPFSSQLHWLEEMPLYELSDEDYKAFCQQWSSTERWLTFFQMRIQRQIDMMHAKAETLRHEAQGVIDRAHAIEVALG